MSLEPIRNIIPPLTEGDTPVVTRYGIATANGTLQLAGAKFAVALLGPDEMPVEISVARSGGDFDRVERYVRSGTTTEVIDLATRLCAALRQLEQTKAELFEKDMVIHYAANQLLRLQQPVHRRLLDGLSHFFRRI